MTTTKTTTINLLSLHKKIDLVTAGQQPYLNKALKEMPAKNATAIADYVLAMQTEINPTTKHRKNLIHSMLHFSSFLDHKSFNSMKKEDILLYLNSYRKPEESDPLHKWIGTYNVRRAGLVKFFRWLYYPEVAADERPVPPFLATIRQLKRKEISIYIMYDAFSAATLSWFVVQLAFVGLSDSGVGVVVSQPWHGGGANIALVAGVLVLQVVRIVRSSMQADL